MSRGSDPVGENARSAVLERASGKESQIRKRRKIPVVYLATHRCKVCDGKHCTGHCKF
jgi:hypothetical protein